MDPTISGFVYGVANEYLEGGGVSIIENPIKSTLMMALSGSIYSVAAIGIAALIPERFHSVFSGVLVFTAGYRIANKIFKR